MLLTTLTQLSLSPLRFEIHMSFRLSIPCSSLQTATAQTLACLGRLIWAATGNRTLIEGSTSLSNNRYTIAAISLRRYFQVGIVIPIF